MSGLYCRLNMVSTRQLCWYTDKVGDGVDATNDDVAALGCAAVVSVVAAAAAAAVVVDDDNVVDSDALLSSGCLHGKWCKK